VDKNAVFSTIFLQCCGTALLSIGIQIRIQHLFQMAPDPDLRSQIDEDPDPNLYNFAGFKHNKQVLRCDIYLAPLSNLLVARSGSVFLVRIQEKIYCGSGSETLLSAYSLKAKSLVICMAAMYVCDFLN
jgi:hypothetical protein